MFHRIVALVLCGFCAVSLTISSAFVSEPDASPRKLNRLSVSVRIPIDFGRDILPILSGKCFTCHGPDSSTRKAGLRLDQRAAALKRSRSGESPIVPGDAKGSELVRRIFADDDGERMPPKKTGKPLTTDEKALLKRWIEEGAAYQTHWAYVPPVRPKLPKVKNNAWVKNEIDTFVLAKLEAAGLQPSPRADRVTLIRRLSLDLRGLPPTMAEVDAFRADDSSDAYPKLVDRMLASPHYGEKMALHWLDLARFGDTSGYHMDSTRQMWLWRDWVIDAFNHDMPFDRFTIEQLAGDLLVAEEPHGLSSVSVQNHRIATGFNRNTRYNEEGGVDPEEYVVRYNIDRTNTLGQVWLGLTLGCAECHSHKYDPISHKEYYQLFAYFTGIKEPMLEGHHVHGMALAPLLKVPTPTQTKTLAEQQRMVAVIDGAIAKELDRFVYIDPFADQALPATITAEVAARSQRAWQTFAENDATLPTGIRTALKIDSAPQKKLLRYYYLRKINTEGRETIGPLEQDRSDTTKKIQQIEAAIPHSLITEEMAQPRPAYVLLRGDFLNKGERVQRGVPSSLSPLPRHAPSNRLGLARWLISPDHPLTARVTVNRLWAQMFGAGIVRTLGEFGTQGDYPSHPELLDWLAFEFRAGDSPWSNKRLLRTIALSATYQQSSIHRADAAKVDPHNRLLSYASRHRLAAEELRDNALAISGLLNPTIGGPSFMPYQPRDFYKFKNEDWPWTPSAGDEQYRRGIYAFWRRTSLHPMFETLDAPNREECTVLRARTNTPLQALVTLNDPTFVEAARVFAQKLLTHGPKDRDARLTFAFRKATCRAPSDAELRVLRHRFEQQRLRFARDANAAASFVNAGQFPLDPTLDVAELATWTALCNLVLNLDEVLTRE